MVSRRIRLLFSANISIFFFDFYDIYSSNKFSKILTTSCLDNTGLSITFITSSVEDANAIVFNSLDISSTFLDSNADANNAFA